MSAMDNSLHHMNKGNKTRALHAPVIIDTFFRPRNPRLSPEIEAKRPIYARIM